MVKVTGTMHEDGQRWRGTVPVTGSPFGLVMLPGWYLLVMSPLMLVAVLGSLPFQRALANLLLIPPLVIGTVVGWRIIRMGLVVSAAGVSRRGFFTMRWIPANEVVEVATRPRHMPTLEALTSPYRERYEAVLLLVNGEEVTSPALVGGIKRRQWNNIAPDLALLEWRAHRISEILRLQDPPPRVSRRRSGRTVSSRPWPA